ncbi:MAG TPA: response regulator transcription factor [Nitrospiraceae bacterium]|nr:response regulator transcription factor [Nitrospiraceae bacterium]
MRMEKASKSVSDHPAIRVLRVLIASPNEARREQWGQALKSISAVHEVGELVDLRRNMTNLKPTVLLLDMALPELHGASDVSAIQRLNPATKIILLTKAPAEDEGTSMLEAGVRGYCAVDIDRELLKKAVQMVHKGEIWVGRKFISQLLDALVSLTEKQRAKSVPLAESLERLTLREREIVQLLGGGASNKEIATQLHVSEKTVKAHLTSIFRKLGVSDRLHLALFVNGHKPESL